ncbi:hypothetical protein J2W94_000525 [Pseudoxanthomonas sacheonensis]|uniref:Uncharacterized protein n=1 Tax=Pseudoxanthomonas sacheonensis TaxID=443615 RepID=A0ABU1RNA2_9GAMM|nr:hypothetical protein [Pseudoxanthomonas sacheonensis]
MDRQVTHLLAAGLNDDKSGFDFGCVLEATRITLTTSAFDLTFFAKYHHAFFRIHVDVGTGGAIHSQKARNNCATPKPRG